MNPFTYGRVVSQKNYCVRPELEAKLKARTLACQNTYLEGVTHPSPAFESSRHCCKVYHLVLHYLVQ